MGLLSLGQEVRCELVHGDFESLKDLLLSSSDKMSQADETEVLHILNYQVEKGDLISIVGLGVIHESGFGGIQKDSIRAANLYLDAARLGSLDGMKEIARLY